MTTSDVVRTKIDGDIKRQASAVLAGMGMSVSDAVRLPLTRIAGDKALPFDPFPPPTSRPSRRCGKRGTASCPASTASMPSCATCMRRIDPHRNLQARRTPPTPKLIS
jgi:DNA-damage-inducible protein J